MTQHKHIVQVHPVENGEVNLYKVEFEKEFETREEAAGFIRLYNYPETEYQAVYRGRVNDATGELE
jgi:hypothetical protein